MASSAYTVAVGEDEPSSIGLTKLSDCLPSGRTDYTVAGGEDELRLSGKMSHVVRTRFEADRMLSRLEGGEIQLSVLFFRR